APECAAASGGTPEPAEVRRFECEMLALLGERRLDHRQRGARLRREHEFPRFVDRDAVERTDVQYDLGLQRSSIAAAARVADDLRGLAVRIEGALESLLLLQIRRLKLHLHQIALLHANAMLAGQHATHLDAKREDIGTEALGPFELIVATGVVENQRMQVAVAGVKDVGDRQAIGLSHLADTAEY